MKIGIIGAMEEEVKVIKQALKNPQGWTRAGVIFHQGLIGNHEIVLVQSGIGKVHSAITATLLIHEFKLEAIVNTGSAGGIGKGLFVGDIVLSEKTAYFDVDVTGFNYDYGQLPGQPLYFSASKYLLFSMQQAAEKMEQTVSSGLIVTGDSFVNDPEKIADVKKHFPKALALEMEGAAISQVAQQFGIGCLIVRAISDTADEHATVSFDEFIIEAGEKSAKMVLKFLEVLE
ncbi:MAG: 5'-methylthioadenosine/adenosylhomocysteine nucleosidase [Streptococcaceae bacterium]|jgi:adenosylhomocysteine nucleosidase|nr:5'-methylthioadenosine/adenosylhomocysteine nucleosidase [Streptococcaceae bacterium]